MVALVDPYPLTRDLTLDKVREALATLIPQGKARETAINRVAEPWREPTFFPAPGDGGFNNARIFELAANRLFTTGDPSARAFAIAWIKNAYLTNARDEQHRQIPGLHMLALYAKRVGDTELLSLCDQVIRSQSVAPGMGWEKLKTHADLGWNDRAGFPNLRTILRASTNVLFAAEWWRRHGDKDFAAVIARDAREALRWFLSLRWKRPVDGYPGEVPGFGVDSEGIPFHADYLGRGQQDWWKYLGTPGDETSGNSKWMPWQLFYLLVSDLLMIDRMEFLKDDEDLEESVEAVLHAMHKLFWARGYYDSDDPNTRGMGQTTAYPIFKSIDPLVVARPHELGIATGEMLWTPLALAGTWEQVGRMLEALVVQGEKNWREDYPKMLWDTVAMELYAQRLAGAEKPNVLVPERHAEHPRRAAMKRMARAARTEGFEPEFDLFLDVVRASSTYLKTTRGGNRATQST